MLIGGAALATCGILAVTVIGLRAADEADVDRGRYLVTVGGCNDCHTPGYLVKAGNVPEDRWLVGDSIGFSGPWGTTYPSNLRRLLANMSEDDWVRYARTLETRPPAMVQLAGLRRRRPARNAPIYPFAAGR